MNRRISLALAASAASALIYEVAITQILFFYFVESSYSLATVLSVFLGGLGIGSYLTHLFANRLYNKKLLFGIFQLVIAVFSVVVLANLTLILPHISTWGMFFTSVFLLLLPTIGLGAAFPLAGYLFSPSDRNTIGLVYAVDLIGAVLGALVAGFLLLPELGAKNTILIGAGLNILSGLIVLQNRGKALFLAGFVLLGLVGFSGWQELKERELFGGNEFSAGVTFLEHSPYGTVKVEDGELYINERRQCGFSWDDATSESQMAKYALAPFLGSQKQVDVLNIGLGCGLTISRALRLSPSAVIDVVEVNPTVVAANKKFSDVLRESRVSLIVEEGMQYLRRSDKKYDAILIDVEQPDIAYSSDLYTVEAFREAAGALNRGGVFALWNYEKVSATEKAPARYFDILFYSLKEAFPYVYRFPEVFIASTEKLSDREEYRPTTSYDVNTIDRRTLLDAYLTEL